MENTQNQISAVIDNQQSEIITKKIHFKKETLRNLVTVASREYFDSKLKPDDILSQMLDQIINSYYAEYWKTNYKLFFQEGDNLSDEDCAEQFEKLNDGNEMSDQEFRTSIISDLNKYILEKSNFEASTSLKCFQRKHLIEDEKKIYTSNQHKITFPKRGFDAFVAKTFYLVMTDYSQPLAEKNITKMYQTEKEIESLKSSNDNLLKEARAERDLIIREAKELAVKMVEESKTTAKVEAEKIMESSRKAIIAEKTAAISDIKAQIADFSIQIAEKLVVGELASDEKQKALSEKLASDFNLN